MADRFVHDKRRADPDARRGELTGEPLDGGQVDAVDRRLQADGGRPAGNGRGGGPGAEDRGCGAGAESAPGDVREVLEAGLAGGDGFLPRHRDRAVADEPGAGSPAGPPQRGVHFGPQPRVRLDLAVAPFAEPGDEPVSAGGIVDDDGVAPERPVGRAAAVEDG